METHSRSELYLLSCGANSYGQLGQGHDEDQSEPRLCDHCPALRARVRAVSGGGGHSVLVTENGEVYVCGQNHRGQLGLGHTSNISSFQLCLGLNQKVTGVACGWEFTLFITDGGQLLACGSNAFGQLGVEESVTHSLDPRLVEVLKEPVVSVAAGLRHSLAATGSGCVYQWGTGLLNQAKRALSPQPVPSYLCSKVPCLVPGLDLRKSYRVAAGSAHSVCLTGDGDLFLWGSNKHCQLLSSDPFVPCPRPLRRSLLQEENVGNVWCGWTHVVAQTESGRVFTWGRGDYGQLGRPPPTNQGPTQTSAEGVLPSEVKDLCGATQISCGSEHNLALVGSRLFSWGWNEHGMCGNGSQINVIHPQLISALRRPLLIGCGAGHSLVVCSSKPN
ncbi:secretion-regulating guanine nucleotide exchange factor isoform X1 [Gouania willdenowi]|uniref:secretion-regulating guanine nucleotide exchange factor isoform X1 n=1 Tax=Gouania willdenowi TaxID=441366 RepID=UPI0010542D97|nr:secretion-regulating guanine nucleotide exchange factor isoform X1 [Gouania willdenowi]